MLSDRHRLQQRLSLRTKTLRYLPTRNQKIQPSATIPAKQRLQATFSEPVILGNKISKVDASSSVIGERKEPTHVDQLTANDLIGLCATTYTPYSLLTGHQKLCLALVDTQYPHQALEPTTEQTFYLNKISQISPHKQKSGESLSDKILNDNTLTSFSTPQKQEQTTAEASLSQEITMIDTTSKFGERYMTKAAIEVIAPRSLVSAFDRHQSLKIFDYNSQELFVEEPLRVKDQKAGSTFADRVLEDIHKSNHAMQSGLIDIDHAESYYLDIDLKEAMIELERAIEALNIFDKALQFSGQKPHKSHHCEPKPLFRHLSEIVKYNVCTQLCTLLPGVMFRRKSLKSRIARAQVRINMCNLELNKYSAKQINKPTKWYPKHYSKDIRKLLDTSPQQQFNERLQTTTVSRCPIDEQDSTDFSHIPQAIKEQYVRIWKEKDFSRTFQDVDNELAFLECVHVDGGNLIKMRFQYSTDKKNIGVCDINSEEIDTKYELIYNLLSLTPHQLNSSEVYKPRHPGTEPLNYRYSEGFVTYLQCVFPQMLAQMQETSNELIWLSAAYSIWFVAADPESSVTELDVARFSQLNVVQDLLMASVNSYELIAQFKKDIKLSSLSTSQRTRLKSLCSVLKRHIYKERLAALTIIIRPLTSEQTPDCQMILKNYGITNQQITMKMAGASVPKRKSNTEPSSKAVKVIELCHFIDKLIAKFQAFLQGHSKLCELEAFSRNTIGCGLLRQDVGKLLKGLGNCFASVNKRDYSTDRFVIKHSKQMPQYQKTVAENSVIEAMHLTEATLDTLKYYEGALTVTLETVVEVFLKHGDIGLIAKQMEHAGLYDSEFVGIQMKTHGFGKLIRERKCYVLETEDRIKVILAGKAPSLSDYTRRLKNAAIPKHFKPAQKQIGQAATEKKRETKSEHKMQLRQRRSK